MGTQVFIRLHEVVFDKIAFAHNLAADNYTFQINTHGYGIYGKAPAGGGVLEIGFVEQNPIICSGPLGDFTFEENGIFIIPPQSNFTVSAKDLTQLHRHTSAEFLIRCTAEQVDRCPAPDGKSVTLPLYIPPSADNSEIFNMIRSIARNKTAQLERTYFEECADFMLLLNRLCAFLLKLSFDFSAVGSFDIFINNFKNLFGLYRTDNTEHHVSRVIEVFIKSVKQVGINTGD